MYVCVVVVVVVVGCDSAGKLLYSNVNLKDVGHMAPFNTAQFSDSLAFATPSTLIIGYGSTRNP